MHDDAVNRISREIDRIAPLSSGAEGGAFVFGLDPEQLLQALRRIPSGPGDAAIQHAVEELGRGTDRGGE